MQSKQTVMLTPGDVVARPVTDKVGNVLVQAGVEMTPTIIKVLERRGVTEVFIQDAAIAAAEEAEPAQGHGDTSEIRRAQILALEERLHETFKHVAGDHVMTTLQNAALRYLTQKIKQGAG